MIYSIFATEDTTLYEATQSLNTGHDAILEVSKVGDISGSQLAANNVYNSRPLIKFNLTSISESVADGTISTNFSAYLNLYTTELTQLDGNDPIVVVQPVSESWTEGVGREQNTPQTLKGVSWVNRSGESTTGTAWTIHHSASTNPVDGSGSNGAMHNGGGTWFQGYDANQTYTQEQEDKDRANIMKKLI